jgi:CRP-like cAMP-binding protein
VTGGGPTASIVSAAIAKLEAFTRLSSEDRQALEALGRNAIEVEARQDLIREGDEPRYVHLGMEGWACRYKTLPDGQRQIVGFFLPGDFCDLNVYVLREMDHSVGAITRLKVARITREQMESLTANHPRITQALWWQELVSAAIQREWTLNLGQRSAYQRLAHVLAEVYIRLHVVDMARDGRCDFPLTQNELADTTGLTSVHVNRMIQELRRDGLIELERKQLCVPDLGRLMDAGLFNPNYLHLDREGGHLDANA